MSGLRGKLLGCIGMQAVQTLLCELGAIGRGIELIGGLRGLSRHKLAEGRTERGPGLCWMCGLPLGLLLVLCLRLLGMWRRLVGPLGRLLKRSRMLPRTSEGLVLRFLTLLRVSTAHEAPVDGIHGPTIKGTMRMTGGAKLHHEHIPAVLTACPKLVASYLEVR